MGIRQDTWTFIKEAHDGLIKDESGRATRVVADAMNVSVTHASGILRQLEEDGYISRSLKGRRTYAIKAKGSRPPADPAVRRSTPKVDPEVIVVDLPKQTNGNGHIPTRARSKKVTDRDYEAIAVRLLREVLNERSWKDRFDSLTQEMAKKAEPTSALRDVKATLVAREERLAEVEAELAEMRESLRIAEHNAEVWKDKAKSGSQLLDLRNVLRTKDREMLDGLMKKLPSGH